MRVNVKEMEATIPKNIETRDDRDFSFLRNEGFRHIEEMSRKLWSDYNSHDPGITFLEVLCYAITDLGNRINLPIRDLITPPKVNHKPLNSYLPTAKKILTVKPVSEADYRKLFIDIEGVHNAFIRINKDQKMHIHCLQKDEPTAEDPQGKLSYTENLEPDYEKADEFILKGLYDIWFEPVYDIRFSPDDNNRKKQIEEITNKIQAKFHSNRNLCEDLVNVEEVEYLELLVCGDVQLEHTADANEVMVELLFRIQEHLSPSVKRYSLNQLLDAGIAVEDIYDGPVLQNGFIRDDELKKADFKKEIHLSDLVQIVMETRGVSGIKKLHMSPCNSKDITEELEVDKWKICSTADFNKLLRLCLDKSIKTTNLFKDVIPIDVDPEIVKQKLAERFKAHQKSLQLTYEDLPIEPGTYYDTGHYSTIQNDLPQIYGTGEYGLSASLPEERHAKALQLKSYLLFFDQILATYFGHLQHTGQLLSAEIGSGSYFVSEVSGVKDLNLLLKDSSSYDSEVAQLLKRLDDFDVRKNQFLDHLLARFAENMNEYAFAMLADLGETVTSATLWHKSTLLKEYPEISSGRGTAFNYFGEEHGIWNTYNVSGLKHRLARLLGIRNYARRDLTAYNFDIYLEEDTDTENEWRWRINDDEENILFSSSKHYSNREAAERELWITVSNAWNPDRYDLRLTEDEEEYYFNLVDETGEVVARQIDYFSTEAEAMAQISGIIEYMSNRISDEGMFLFEHILFRPDRDDQDAKDKFIKICLDSDCKQCKPADPYSLQLTFVFPGWTRRFSNLYFREYAENLIRREVPAHILCRICWIGNIAENEEGEETTKRRQMSQLEELYKKWLTKKMKNSENQKENEFLKPLVDLLHDLETIYPAGTLHDCEASGDSSTSIVLGHSTIGELKPEEENGSE